MQQHKLYQVVRCIDGGGCFGAPQYEILKESEDLEDCKCYLFVVRSTHPMSEFFDFKLREVRGNVALKLK